jgi:hypothetical protein
MNIFSTEHPSPPPPKPWSRKKTMTVVLGLFIAAIQWGQFYYDHQDDYWGRSRAEVDKAFECIKIYRDGQVTAAFYWESEKLRRFRSNFTLRESIGAHQWMPPGWNI